METKETKFRDIKIDTGEELKNSIIELGLTEDEAERLIEDEAERLIEDEAERLIEEENE